MTSFRKRLFVHVSLLGAVLAATVGTAGEARVASGTTVIIVDGELVITAAAGKGNDIGVRRADDPTLILVTDAGDVLIPGVGCQAASTATEPAVTCTAIGVSGIVVHAGDGRDRVGVSFDHPSTINGGPGADSLWGTHPDGAVTIHGGDDVDRVLGGGGTDKLFGDAGNDRISGGRGDDELRVAPTTTS